jgi:N-acetylmuramoyl-L-alanine amidase
MNPQRRRLLKTGTLVLLLGRAQLARGASILGVRVWPANDYTRVTIESDTALVVVVARERRNRRGPSVESR